eukprot:13062115-Heterocapsa_arctica.AAC.1
MGPIRGVDYVIARAAADAGITPDSPYGKFLANVLLACAPDMVRHLPFVLAINILQTLQQSKSSAGQSSASGWLTSTMERAATF